MKILVSEKLSEHKYKTPEGYLICTDAILARTGKQSYTKDEVFGDGDNTEIDIDRPYDQVMNEKTIASFENKPVTFDHPEEDVNVGNYKSYAVGYVRDVRQGKVDGKDVILGNLVITDQDAINAIESGEHTDLSCGYDCDIKDDGNGGYAQNNIRGNHVALCREGRAGMAKIIDSKMTDNNLLDTINYKGIKIGVLHTSVGTLYEVRYNKNKADWPEYKKLENAKKYIDIFLTKGEQAANASWKIDDTTFKVEDNEMDDAKDYDWFEGYINGELQSYNIDSLINNVKRKHQSLHTNLAGKSGNVYTVFIDTSLKSNLDDGSDMWIDIIVEKPNGQQKRLISEKFNSWNECQKIFNAFKNKIKDSKMKDDYSSFEKLRKDRDFMKKLETLAKDAKDIKQLRQWLTDNQYFNQLNNAEVKLLLKHELGIDLKDSKEMTMSDAMKMLNIVDAYKKVKDEYLGMVYINGRPMYVIHKKEPGIPEFWGITPSKWGDNPRKKFKSKKELDNYLTSVNAVSN